MLYTHLHTPPADSATPVTSRTKAGVRKTPAPGRPARPGPADGVDPVEVVCRLRPVPDGDEKCVEQLDENTVLVTPPANSQVSRRFSAAGLDGGQTGAAPKGVVCWGCAESSA